MSSKIQPLNELEVWHKKRDPWDYQNTKSDEIRREILINEIIRKKYTNILDIGCGQGFITEHIQGDKIIGIDISHEAIRHAKVNSKNTNIKYLQGSIFNMNEIFNEKFDLIIITGVLYKQYIGDSSSLIYQIIDNLLMENGELILVHIEEWKICNFPFRKIKEIKYPYREFTHNLEIYSK